jgi:multidrug efflux pump subunit AcrB
MDRPQGYRFGPAGEVKARAESFGDLTSAVLVAVFGMLAVLFSGNTLSFTAIIGFIALLGIEIKNSILLTSATAIRGLLPLAAQNIGFYSPMAWVIIGGLLTSTLLARLVTPVMYKLPPPAIEVENAGHEAARAGLQVQRTTANGGTSASVR